MENDIKEIIKDRFQEYKDNNNYYLMNRVPLILEVNGINFTRLTSKLAKPSYELINIFANTMYYAASQIQGVVFAYSFFDKIIFILRNDRSYEEQPWLNNNIQKIVSQTASLVTRAFSNSLELSSKLDLVGDYYFIANVFAVPNLAEALNYLIINQIDYMKESVNMAVYTNLIEKFGRKTAIQMLDRKNVQERKEILKQKCDIDYDEDYTVSFKNGNSLYKVPFMTENGLRNKWQINFETPVFIENRDLIMNILINGNDSYKK